ncbi:hypothetical protein AC781_09940 [Akkermansia glycaniphila]|nr:hypothetical protein AC781_09940 [Akkermansia glycaniphila]
MPHPSAPPPWPPPASASHSGRNCTSATPRGSPPCSPGPPCPPRDPAARRPSTPPRYPPPAAPKAAEY